MNVSETFESDHGDLLQLLHEDVRNTSRLLDRLSVLEQERGMQLHAALLVTLTGLNFTEEEARDHWESIKGHHAYLRSKIGANVAVRTAVLDYFLNINRKLVHPKLIDLEMLESHSLDRAQDTLTSLPNEFGFLKALQRELRRARRFGGSVSVINVDLDRFSFLDQRWGRPLANRLIAETGLILANKIRDIDLAARLGEDEFALLLPETGRNGALLVGERVREAVEQHFASRTVAGESVNLTLSVGVASAPEDASEAANLLQCAGEALYRAKSLGKNRVVSWTPERRRFIRFELEPGRFEVEVLGEETARGDVKDVSASGILFRSPEMLGVGHWIEVRLIEQGAGQISKAHVLRGQVVRCEQLPMAEVEALYEQYGYRDPYEIGVAFNADVVGGEPELWELLARLHDTDSV